MILWLKGSRNMVGNGEGLNSGMPKTASNFAAFGERSSTPEEVILVSSSNQTDPVHLRHHFTGKEDQTMFGTGMPYIDFGARHYSAPLRRWLTPDPLSEKYYDTTPYAYCANNPVTLVDPEGKEFTERSLGYVNSVIDFSNEQIASLSITLSGLSFMNKYFNSENRLINSLISAVKERIQQFISVKNEITVLSKSNQIYDIFLDPSRQQGLISETTFNFNAGTVEMKLAESSLSTIAHELKHAYQFEIGKINFTNEFYTTLDKTDEYVAYNRGELFYGPKYETLPKEYDKLPDGPLDFHYRGLLLTRPDLLEASINCQKFDYAERFFGKTFISRKPKDK